MLGNICGMTAACRILGVVVFCLCCGGKSNHARESVSYDSCMSHFRCDSLLLMC